MLTYVEKRATTTLKVRAEIEATDAPASRLAEQFGTTTQTVYKRSHRHGIRDGSQTPKWLLTTLAPGHAALALRRTLLVSLSDLLTVVRELSNPNASRSNLEHYLRPHWIVNLLDFKAKAAQLKHSAFKPYVSAYIHLNVKYLLQMADETLQCSLFVINDGITRWVFIWIFRTKTTTNDRRFLLDLERVCPMCVRTVLSDNGKEFTGRLFGLNKATITRKHTFNARCAALEIEHRLTQPKSPQSESLSAIGKRTRESGVVERFNGRIEQMIQGHHLRPDEEFGTTLRRYV